jgi:ribose 5-phosphate isomerase B
MCRNPGADKCGCLPHHVRWHEVKSWVASPEPHKVNAWYSGLGTRILSMKIALGADHAGFPLKEKIKRWLSEQGQQVDDKGTLSLDSVDYPDYARKVGEEVAARKADRGVLVCGSGIGMSIAANKVPGVRAANAHTVYEAQLSREHNDANVLTLGARVLTDDEAHSILDMWLRTKFAGGRHQRRVEKIAQIEKEDRVPGT